MNVNSGYAAFQIAKALRTGAEHEDPAARERAQIKAEKWAAVIEGMLSQQIDVGSRQPMREMPVWATPEVLTGGFATGHLLAGGELLPHEESLLARIGAMQAGSERYTLNAYFLSDPGIAELTEMLGSERYDIRVPEEGALLIVAWLLDNGHAEVARSVIDEVSPYFSTLRFYPVPAEQPRRISNRVHLESVDTAIENLGRIQPKPQIMAQREAIQVWIPLYDRAVALFSETVEGELPAIQPDAEGRWVAPETGKFAVVGGWPCRHYAADWRDRANCVVKEYDRLCAVHQRGNNPTKAKVAFARLFAYLRQCADDPQRLTSRDVGMIRLILARHLTKRGAPGSDKLTQVRTRQAEQIAGPVLSEVAAVVQERLSAYPKAGGLDAVDAVIQPLTSEEARWSKIPEGTSIPESIRRKVGRCRSDTVDALVERGIITSGDTLARIVPQISSGIRAEPFDDPRLRSLYAAVYRAFRLRRSLLLLHLEKQVQIEELPWIRVVEAFRRKDLSSRDLSRRTLKEITILTLRSFPHAIIPNKLIQELVALAKGAEWKLPLVEELAADIFMGEFSPKYTEAARQAAELLDGTLYARYYGLDCATIRNLPAASLAKGWSLFRKRAANDLAQHCIVRAGVNSADEWSVARNGMIIEQAQIITTHNLAVLFSELGLTEALKGDLHGMAMRCFQWICKCLQMKPSHHHATLIALKNTAYAWRQMLFYLSHLPGNEVQVFLDWARSQTGAQDEQFQSRFSPALNGLVAVHEGASLDDPHVREQGARRFVGWTLGKHWLQGSSVRQG